jgi:hypothetical protein
MQMNDNTILTTGGGSPPSGSAGHLLAGFPDWVKSDGAASGRCLTASPPTAEIAERRPYWTLHSPHFAVRSVRMPHRQEHPSVQRTELLHCRH